MQGMNKSDWILAAMAAAEGDPWSPVQIQKALFLVSENIPEVKDKELFHFKPYHYGPFDAAIFELIEMMEKDGLTDTSYAFPVRKFNLVRKGHKKGKKLLDQLDDRTADYIRRVADYVHRLSFNQLVRAIYKEYPEMAQNSVFSNR